MNKPGNSLRLTFRHETRPDVFLGRVWVTFWVAALLWSAISCFKEGSLEPAYLIPMPAGTWHNTDPSGNLYVETWATILVNSMQAGFGLWGAVLIFSGVYRAVTTHKSFISCFSLGGAFLGFTYFLPIWAPSLLKIVVERYPFLGPSVQ